MIDNIFKTAKTFSNGNPYQQAQYQIKKKLSKDKGPARSSKKKSADSDENGVLASLSGLISNYQEDDDIKVYAHKFINQIV